MNSKPPPMTRNRRFLRNLMVRQKSDQKAQERWHIERPIINGIGTPRFLKHENRNLQFSRTTARNQYWGGLTPLRTRNETSTGGGNQGQAKTHRHYHHLGGHPHQAPYSTFSIKPKLIPVHIINHYNHQSEEKEKVVKGCRACCRSK